MTGRQDRARAGYHPARRRAAEADARLSRRVPGRNPSRPARAEGQAMSKVVVALALVLASAAPAHAKGAWVLWREEAIKAPDRLEVEWAVPVAYSDRASW